MSKEKYNFERLATNHVHKNENVFNLEMHTIFFTIRPTVHTKRPNPLIRPQAVACRYTVSKIPGFVRDGAFSDSGKVELKM